MQLLDLTLATPEENLALDEALLEQAEARAGPVETLRIWESPEPCVVLGRSSHAAVEVDLDFCRQRRIRVLRRTSGGAAVLIGPGTLMFSVVLSYELRPALVAIDQAHCEVLQTTLRAIAPLAPRAVRAGTSDLAIDGRKFSGNSLRCKRRHLLYHGTLLYAADLALLASCLAMPPRQPDYRQNRPHTSFVTNLAVGAASLRQALIAAWDATEAAPAWPREHVAQLVANRYRRAEWNEQR
ncbi:MAG: biotin/lipoate A/B protein ligase family protein [Pirellulales bacterium]